MYRHRQMYNRMPAKTSRSSNAVARRASTPITPVDTSLPAEVIVLISFFTVPVSLLQAHKAWKLRPIMSLEIVTKLDLLIATPIRFAKLKNRYR